MVIDLHMHTTIHYFHSNKRCRAININTLNLIQDIISKNELAKHSVLPEKCVKNYISKNGLKFRYLGIYTKENTLADPPANLQILLTRN